MNFPVAAQVSRIGIFGGTFDPVHFGHLMLAESCRQQLSLDVVRLIPAGKPPHKPDHRITDGRLRAEMLKLAVSGYPEYIVDERELHRTGASFTVDTLTELKAEFPAAKLFLLLGADSVVDLPNWREPQRIAELATIVAVNRPGFPLPENSQWPAHLGPSPAPRIITVHMPGADISATDLRERSKTQQPLRFLTPRAVEAYIGEQKIYQRDKVESIDLPNQPS